MAIARDNAYAPQSPGTASLGLFIHTGTIHMATINVHLLPRLVERDELAGSVCVVIDVLRATTTMSHALANGAREVIPCLEVDDAVRTAAALPREEYLLGGERGGVKIEGFDLGNSPCEYPPSTVAGKTVIFTTTNGTRALLHCDRAAEVLLAAFVNLSAVCRKLTPAASSQQGKIDVICAGTGGSITREDVLLAGAIADRLSTLGELNDSATLAADSWRGALTAAGLSAGAPEQIDAARLAAILKQSRGGRNLTRLKLEADILDAARIDCLNVVPRFDRQSGRIVI
jgi:2-phosphosulfolactate phosphatase